MTIPVSVERMRDMLVGAFEGGSNYWVNITEFDLPDGVTKADFKEGGKIFFMKIYLLRRR